MADGGQTWRADPDKPWYHIMPREGWLNDPNGPIYYKGRYHLFYQHVTGSSEWAWACAWGHASSADLVTWRHEPVALQPSPGAPDAAGCWSGTVTLDVDGTPTILYTAVKLRADPASAPLPPPGRDLGLDMIECQCAATCSPGTRTPGQRCSMLGAAGDDADMRRWVKAAEPIIPFPPPGMALAGFRDPYVLQRGEAGRPWRIVLGSGVRGRGGALLEYESQHLARGWELRGELTTGTPRPCGACDLGAMWECPFFVALPTAPRPASPPANGPAPAPPPASEPRVASCGLLRDRDEGRDQVHALCVSPYPHHVAGRPTNPCLYWLGRYAGQRFDLEAAAGPFQLDLGDILYAPNTLHCPDGRVLLLAWLQELRPGGGFVYAGCLSLPRLLQVVDGRLHQEPAAEVARLRTKPSWAAPGLDITAAAGISLPDVAGPSCDVKFALEPRGCRRGGLLIRAWLHPGPDGASPLAAAAVVVDWETSRLEVVYPTVLDPGTKTFDWDAPARRIGGNIRIPHGGRVALRVLVDHSAVEVFAGSGEALATRVYRGDMPASADPGLFFVADAGALRASDISAHAMRSIWEEPGDLPVKLHEPAAE